MRQYIESSDTAEMLETWERYSLAHPDSAHAAVMIELLRRDLLDALQAERQGLQATGSANAARD